ncbi:MAG: hypothetical protein E7041_01255 [Lentisphaerae bacterium]|nr:hypothetical protein [Lentisphaerota bacterium]
MNCKKLTVSDYYPAPFWFLNHKLEKPELLRQLKLMKDQGINAFFMHPRAGLKTPYASQEWFDLIRYTAIEADKLGMKAWLYDEDPFPSGPAGGRIFLEHPEFAARELICREFFPDANGRVCADLGTGKLIEAWVMRCDSDGNILEKKDVSADAGMIRSDFFRSEWFNPYYHHLAGKTTYFHYRAETYYPHLQLDIPVANGYKVMVITAEFTGIESKYGHRPDNLNPECVKEFMRWTHDLYEKYMGDLFGTVIPGIFTDETATGGAYAWTPAFSAEFKKRRHMDIDGSYHLIFTGNSPEAQNLREAYWETVHELFIEAFFEPINEWCKSRNMALCGHGIGEELPIATTNGMNIFNIQKYTGIPGMDHITPNIPNWDDFTSLNLGGKLVSSAAEQMGEHRIMTECFACNAYNFGHDGMKKNFSWLCSLGINWAVPHGFHYSYDGFRKDDAGKSFFFQSPDYPEFHKFGAFAAELGYRLGESRSTADICVLYPENEFRRLIPACREQALQKMEALYACNQFLLQNQVQFELADEKTLRQAEVTADGFVCGQKTYRYLILPFELERDYLKKLDKFIIPREKTVAMRQFTVLDAATGNAANTVLTQFRELPDGQGKLLYFFHNSDAPASFKITLNDSGLKPYFVRLGENKVENFPPDSVINLPAYGTALLEFRTAEIAADGTYVSAPARQPDFSYMTVPEWDYIPPVKNIAAVLSKWDFQSGKEIVPDVRYDVMKYHFGTETPHPRRVLPNVAFDRSHPRPAFYPARVTAETRFTFNGVDGAELLFESETFLGSCQLFLNGERLDAPVRCLVYDAWNYSIDISALVKTGENVLRVEWDAATEDEGITSLVYVITE